MNLAPPWLRIPISESLCSTLQGYEGIPGIQGCEGPRGPIIQGCEGPRGPEGPRGSEGLRGPTGATGATGSMGPRGAIGPVGAMGQRGVMGPTGSTGATGAIGPRGSTFYTMYHENDLTLEIEYTQIINTKEDFKSYDISNKFLQWFSDQFTVTLDPRGNKFKIFHHTETKHTVYKTVYLYAKKHILEAFDIFKDEFHYSFKLTDFCLKNQDYVDIRNEYDNNLPGYLTDRKIIDTDAFSYKCCTKFQILSPDLTDSNIEMLIEMLRHVQNTSIKFEQ